MKVVFMGTPDFAVPSLRALIQSEEHQVIGVFTQPDKPKGRGYQLTPPPVKELALQHGIPVFQPLSLKKPPDCDEARELLSELLPEVIVVAAYGKILPLWLLEFPKYGCINIHGSLLPKYRGAGPIQWSVLNGEKETGLTTMQMAEGIDTGDMLLKAVTAIGENENVSELHDRLAEMGGPLLLETLRGLESGSIVPEPQNEAESSHAPMLSKELSPMDFHAKSALELHNQVRGLYGWPCAAAEYRDKRIKIHAAKLAEGLALKPGEWMESKGLFVGTKEGVLEILELQPEGSKRMSAAAYLNGVKGK